MGLRRGGIHGVRGWFFIFLRSLSLSLSLSLLPFLSRAARLRGARRRGSAVCAEFESSCNKIRALCDGLRYPARARVRPAHIYSGKKVKCIQVGYGVYKGGGGGGGRGGGIYLSPFACPTWKRRRSHSGHRISPGADVNNTAKSLPEAFSSFFFLHYAPSPPLPSPAAAAAAAATAAATAAPLLFRPITRSDRRAHRRAALQTRRVKGTIIRGYNEREITISRFRDKR